MQLMGDRIYKYTLFLSLGFFAFIIANLNWNILFDNIKRYRVADMISVLCIYLVISIVRALRLRVSILGSNISIQKLFVLNLKFGFYQSILPAQTADLIYANLVKKQLDIDLRYGNLSIFLVRATDVIILASGLVLELMMINVNAGLALKLIPGLLMLAILFLLFRIELLINILNKLARYFQSRMFHKTMKTISGALDELKYDVRDHYNKAIVTKIIGYGLLAWLLTAGNFIILFNMLSIHVSYLATIFLVSMVNLAAILPVSSIGGIGVREPALMLGLMMLGFDVNSSALGAILVRLPMYLLPLSLGMVCVLLCSGKMTRR